MPAAWIMSLRWHVRQHRNDLFAVVVLFVGGALAGGLYTATWGGKAEFWQEMFGPQVLAVCGLGYTNPMLSEAPELEAFLFGAREDFTCDLLPETLTLLPRDHGDLDYDAVQAFHPTEQFPGWTRWQEFHRYLLFAVGVCWRLFGIAWSSVWPLHALLYGISCVAVYGIARLAMTPPFAFLAGMLLLTSPLHLQMAPHLRDYGKAPFFLVSIFFMGLVLRCQGTGPRYAAIGLAAGLWMGVGLGFRQDILICMLLFGVIALGLAPGSFYQTAALRLVLVGCFALGVAVAGWPIATVLYKVSNAPHDTLIGFARYCDDRLGVAAPTYDFGDPFKDEYTRAQLETFAYQQSGATAPLRHYSAEYDAVGEAYFSELVRNFPADMATRAIASVLRCADELQVGTTPPTPKNVTHAVLAKCFTWRQHLLNALPGAGRYYVVLTVLLIGAYNFQMGLGVLLLWLALTGYPALRFSTRHAFHMEFVPIFALCYLMFLGWRAALWFRVRLEFRSLPSPLPWKGPAVRAAALAGVAVISIVPTLYALRALQSGRIVPLLEAREQAPRIPLQHTRDTLPTGETVVRMPYFRSAEAQRVARPMQMEYLVLELAPREDAAALTVLYEAEHPNFNFTRWMTLPGHPGSDEPTRIYIPIYFNERAQFQGFALSPALASAFQGVYRVEDPERLDPYLTAYLFPGWATAGHFQRLSR